MISELSFQYLHRQLSANGQTPTLYTATAGTARSASTAALVEADGYWIGAIVVWVSGANAGLYSHVLQFSAATLTFAETLPNAVQAGDQFRLLLGGKWVTDQRIPGMTASALANVTGFTLSFVSMLNGAGIGTLRFFHNGGADQTVSWTPPGGTEGPEVVIGGLLAGESVQVLAGGANDLEKSALIVLTRSGAALPAEDGTDNVVLAVPVETFLAPFSGEQCEAGTTIYRPVGLKNLGTGAQLSMRAWLDKPFANAVATTIAAGSGGLGIGSGTLSGTSLANWGTHGWVFNSTKNDLRYYVNRSGNSVSILAPGAGVRGFTATTWADGDTIEPYPWCDIGVDAPAGGAYEDPANPTIAPAGVTFTCPRAVGEGLVLGDLPAGGLFVIWERLVIPAGFQPLANAEARLMVFAETN